MNAANPETVLITGASSGIGLELARCFAADKSNLILIARSTDALEKLAGELRAAHGITARVLTADLSLPGCNPVRGTKFARQFLQRRRGGILNVGSVAGFLPGPNMAVYYASKAFVLSFTEALAEEMSGSGLTFSVLCPGPTESNFGNVARGGKTRQVQRQKMSAATVARIGHQKFRAEKIVVVPGISNQLLAFSTRIVSRTFARKIVKKYNRTKE